MCSDKKDKTKAIDGKMLVFAAPSGSGKTTIVRHLLDKYEQVAFSVSATTRPIRYYEEQGKDYYFLSNEDFRDKIENNAFVEWVEVYEGRFYGTLKAEVERLWKEGKYVLFDIDVVGAMKIKEHYGEKCLSVFIKPPGIKALIERLKNRKTESEESLKIRKERFKKELEFENRFDEVIINDELAVALERAEALTESFLEIQKPRK